MTLTCDIWVANQSLRGTLIDDAHEPKLRADVRRNAYDEQSWARVESWSENGWQQIRHMPIQATHIFAHSYVEPGMGKDQAWRISIRRDMDNMLNFARAFYRGGQ